MTERDKVRLTGVHPDLAEKISRVLDAMALLGFPMGVTDGVRTQAEQLTLWQIGRERTADGVWHITGQVVTNADGVLKRSNHQPHADGWGHAIDCAFLKDLDSNGEPDEPRSFTWDDARPWNLYGVLVESQGLVWGGRWKLVDRPHAELPSGT